MQSLMLPVTTFKVEKSSLLYLLNGDNSLLNLNNSDIGGKDVKETAIRKKTGLGLDSKSLPVEIHKIMNTKESSRVKCRFKIEKKVIKLNKKEKDYIFKLTPFTMIATYQEIVLIFNTQSTLLPSLSFNKTLLIRVADSSAREELKLAVQENVASLVKQQFNQKKFNGRGIESKMPFISQGCFEGYVIRSNVSYTSIQNIVYQRPSVVYSKMKDDEIIFYKSHELLAIADVIAFKVDMRTENVSVRPMIGNPLGFEILVNNEIREQFVSPNETERNQWVSTFQETISRNLELRQNQKASTKSHNSLSREPSSIHSDDENSFVHSSDEGSESSGSVMDVGSQRSTGSYQYNDVDSTGASTRRTNSIFEEPDFLGESAVNSVQTKHSLFSADFWNSQKRRKSIASTATSQVEYLQQQLEQRDQELKRLREEIQSLNLKLNDQSSSTHEDDDFEEPDFL